MDNVSCNKIIVASGRIIDCNVPKVMAIINATPDSFYSGSRNKCVDELRQTIIKAVEEGADILDVGGYSTRPGAGEVSVEEETERVSMALEVIRTLYPKIPVSVDTFRGDVARKSVIDFGVDIINDVSAFELDQDMFDALVELQVPYIMMHSRGNSRSMQSLTQYDDFVPDVLRFFAAKIDRLRNAGFSKEIIVDPGFGFAKTVEQNYELLGQLPLFETFKAPILVGVSRKTMIWRPLGITPEQSLNGTTALNTMALMYGANILRVHDVKEAVEAVKLFEILKNNKYSK